VRPAVLPFLVLALVDVLGTIYGTWLAIDNGRPVVSAIIGLIVGSAVLITLLSTFDIWGSWHPVLSESPVMTQLLRAIWAVAFVYDWATTVVAILNLAGLHERGFDLWHMITTDRPALMSFVAAGAAALVVCGATLVVSFMAYNERREGAAEA
jgi:hypothetical protein